MKKIGMSLVLVCTLLLTACSEDAESISGGNSSAQIAVSDSGSSIPANNLSSSADSNSETSSSSVVQEQPQPEKIPLTEKELKDMETTVFWLDCYLGRQLFNDQREYDLKTLLESPESMENHSFDMALGMVMRKCEPDKTKAVESEFVNQLNLYSPQTVQKYIKENFIPDFNISRIDYKKSDHWSAEDNMFSFGFGADGGFIDVPQVVSGYKQGDEYHLIAYGTSKLNMKLPSSENLDFPIKEIVIKNDCLISCKNATERPEWINTAENLYKMLNKEKESWEKVKNVPNPQGGYLRVISGDPGKRLCADTSYFMGSHSVSAGTYYYTFGARGKNDFISYEYNSHGSMVGYLDPNPENMYFVSSGSIIIHDYFKGETYENEYTSYSDGNPPPNAKSTESYTLNGRNISKEEFNSAEVKIFFDNFDDSERTILKCEHDWNNLTLGDLFEIAKVMTD